MPADPGCRVDDFSVGGSREQDEIAVWVLDDEILRAPGFLPQSLVEFRSRGLEIEKELLDFPPTVWSFH